MGFSKVEARSVCAAAPHPSPLPVRSKEGDGERGRRVAPIAHRKYP